MLTFNSSKTLKALLISAVLALSACNLPETQKKSDSDGMGSFFADDISGNLLSEKLLKEISLPNERTYSMKVCLRDLQFSKPVLNHPFTIEEISKDLKTDSTGCLTWNEEVSFEYLADPVFIKVDRTIKSKGIHSGAAKVSFAVNPWDTDNYHSTIDLSKTKVEPLVSGDDVKQKLAGQSQKSKFNLWVEDGRLFVNDEKMGDLKNNSFQLKYDFNLTPYIKTKKTSGDDTTYNLKYGLFNGRIEVIQKYYDGASDKNIFEVISSKNFFDAKMEKGVLTFTETMTFMGGPPSRGSIFLRFYLEPKKPVANLNSFVGLFSFGDFRSIRVNQFLKILPSDETGKEIAAQLPLNRTFMSASTGKDGKDNSGQTLTVSKNGKADSTISWSNIEFDSVSRAVQLLNHKRKIIIPAHICFTNNLIQMPISFQNFKVRGYSQDEAKPGEYKTVRTSNVNGCIYWTDEIEYDIYECGRYLEGYVIIENPDFNLKIKKYYYINPWDEYFGGKDKEVFDTKKALETSCSTENPKKSEIVLNEISFKTHAAKFNGDINSLLEFGATKKLGITLHPMVKIPSHLKKDIDSSLENLVDGAYLLRVMIVKNVNLHKKFEVLAYKDIPVVNTRTGTIYAEFPFSVKDHRLFTARNTLFLQLLPLKHEKIIAPNDFQVSLKNPNEPISELINPNTSLLYPIFFEDLILDGETSKTLRTYSGSEYMKHLQIDYKNKNPEFDFDKLAAEYEQNNKTQQANAAKLMRPEAYAPVFGLDYVNESQIGSLPFGGWAQSALTAGQLKMDEKTSKQICDYWFQTVWKGKFNLGELVLKQVCNSAAKNNIKSFFDFDRVYFVNTVSGSEYAGPGPERGLSLGTSFSVSTSYSESFASAIGGGAKAGVGKDFAKFASVGAEVFTGFEWGYTTSRSDANSIALSEGVNLSVTESRFRIKTADYQFCFSVKPKGNLFQPSSKGLITQLWHGDIDYSQFFKSNVSNEEKLELSRKGLLICKSTRSNTPMVLNEQYFWVTHQMGTNEVQDANDDRNKIFNIMIRGHQDYSRFKYHLSRKWKRPEGAGQDSNNQDYLSGLMQVNSYKVSPPGVHIFREQ